GWEVTARVGPPSTTTCCAAAGNGRAMAPRPRANTPSTSESLFIGAPPGAPTPKACAGCAATLHPRSGTEPHLDLFAAELRHAPHAPALGAGARQQLLEALAGALARHLHEAELRDAQHVRAGLVLAERLLEGVEHLLAVGGLLHVDEVDHDDAADVAQPELLDDLLCRLEVDAQDRLLLVLLADVASGVDVHRGQRLRLFEDQVPPRLEPHPPLERAGDLGLDAVLLEEG